MSDEMNARLEYAAKQREHHANDAAGWYGRAESLRLELEAVTAARDALQAQLSARAGLESAPAKPKKRKP